MNATLNKTTSIDYTPVINPIIDSFRSEQLEKVDLQVRAMETLMERLERSGLINSETTAVDGRYWKETSK